MTLIKWGIAAAIVASVIGTGKVAQAAPLDVANGTYVFFGAGINTAQNTALDGSSVTFLNDSITGWNFVDSLDHVNPLPLTPSNSHIASSGVLGANSWYFTIDANVGNDFFEGENNLNLGSSFPAGDVGAIFDGPGDPYGNWTLTPSPLGDPTVPETTSTFALLGAALVALAAGKSFVRSRSAAQA